MQNSETVFIQQNVDRLNAGDDVARTELINYAVRHLHRLAHRMLIDFPRVQNVGQTDDIAQGAALRLWKALQSVTPESPTHFFRLVALQVRRELIDVARGCAKIPFVLREDTSEEKIGIEIEVTTYDPNRLNIWCEFHEFVDAMSDEHREMMDFFWYQEVPQTEVAELLGVSIRTIKRRWQATRLVIHEAFNGRLF